MNEKGHVFVLGAVVCFYINAAYDFLFHFKYNFSFSICIWSNDWNALDKPTDPVT